MGINETIRYYRKQNGLSQEDVAKRMGTTKQTVSRWERNQVNVSYSTLLKLEKILHCRLVSEKEENYEAITDKINDIKKQLMTLTFELEVLENIIYQKEAMQNET